MIVWVIFTGVTVCTTLCQPQGFRKSSQYTKWCLFVSTWFVCQKVNTGIGLARPAFVSEWKWFSEGRIKGEIFLIHPLAVVKWHSAKATLPKSAQAQVNESALNHSRVRFVYCWLRHTSAQSSQSINRLFHPQCIQGLFVCFFLRCTHCYEYGQKCAHRCFTITCILIKQYYLETG